MVKSFFIVRDTWRGAQSYMEKRRGRREIEVTKRRGEIKRGESKLASNHFPEMFMELHREKKREEGERGGQGDKRGTQKERDRSSQ